jgi:hypothetical protein
MSDYISREEVKDIIRMGVSTDTDADKEYVCELIDSLKTADVRENIHGEWIPKERATECSIDIDIVCSECGYVGIKTYAHGYELDEINIQKVRDYTKELDMNFCTCCGADMRGGE